VFTLVSMAGSVGMLGLALRQLPLGTAYAVWTGVGAVGTAIVGIVLFKEPATAARLVCLGLIVAGILGLKVFSAGSAA
jgi:quaternary ammonium compound-resistance protein SugE